MVARRSWSAKQRLALFTKHKGVCHICFGLITVGEAWDVSHEIPLALGGADDDVNAMPAHKKCHRATTSTTDIPAIAKAKRREVAHVGARAPAAKPIRSAPFALPPITKRKSHPMPLDALPRRSLFAGEA